MYPYCREKINGPGEKFCFGLSLDRNHCVPNCLTYLNNELPTKLILLEAIVKDAFFVPKYLDETHATNFFPL